MLCNAIHTAKPQWCGCMSRLKWKSPPLLTEGFGDPVKDLHVRGLNASYPDPKTGAPSTERLTI